MEVKDIIQNAINENDVVLFMKGTPDAPQCGFSAMVVGVLNKFDVEFQGVNVLQSNELRQGIKDFSDWPTIPQLYVKGEFIGGADIVKEMVEDGSIVETLGIENK
jgi:monothiol glutaredoxin